jgi:hypothetical protein
MPVPAVKLEPAAFCRDPQFAQKMSVCATCDPQLVQKGISRLLSR